MPLLALAPEASVYTNFTIWAGVLRRQGVAVSLLLPKPDTVWYNGVCF